jgi:MFS family permease
MGAPQHLPPNVLVLGAVSLLMGISSTIVLSLMPGFLVQVLGASALWVGTIEGAAESTASITKILSGAASDWIGRRKPLVALGYGLSAFVKLGFPLAQAASHVLFARIIDRIGKGVRDAPRDAFVADITAHGMRGTGFGLRHALFSLGAVLGPLAATALMTLTGDNFRAVYWIATLPGFLALALVIWRVVESPPTSTIQHQKLRLSPRSLRQLPPEYWHVLVFACVISLARIGQVFLLLKAVSIGVEAALVPMVLAVVNSAYATTSFPFGILADRLRRHLLLGLGALALLAAEIVLALTGTFSGTLIGAALWGLQMGALQALFGAIIADSIPEELRGTAFGLFDLMTGVVVLIASVFAGALWLAGGALLTFGAGAVLSAGALVVLVARQQCGRNPDSVAG